MSCSMEPRIATITFLAISVISCIACALVIFICLTSKILDSMTSRVLICMSTSDILRCFSFFVPSFTKNEFACIGSAVIFQLTFLSTILLAACIAITLYQVLIKTHSEFDRRQIIWIASTYIISGFITALPLITNSYGRVGDICTLKTDRYANIWRITLDFIPYWAVVLCVMWMLPKLYYSLKHKNVKSPMCDLIFSRGYVYSLIIVFLVVLTTAARTVQESSDDCTSQYFFFIDTCLLNLHGSFNSLAFFLNPNIRKAISRTIKKEDRESADKFHLPFEPDGALLNV